MSRTLPVLILRLLASRVALAGLQAFQVFASYAARVVAPAAQHDPAALDADERAMFEETVHLGNGDSRYAMCCDRDGRKTVDATRVTCAECMRQYHALQRMFGGRPS